MKLDVEPNIISLSGSYKNGRDEYYHRLSYHSLILFDGFCRFQSEGFSREMKPGDLLLVPSGSSRIYREPRSLISRHGHFALDEGPEEVLYIPLGDEFRPFCREFDAVSLLQNRNPRRAGVRFWEMLFRSQELIERAGGEEESGLHPALIRAVNYVEFHFHEKIDVDDLAAFCSISHNQLLRLFRREFGLTIIAYLRQKRMAYAGELLTQTTLPIKEISYKCGYGDRQHFNKAVRRSFGLSPRSLRQSPASPLFQG